MTSQTISESDEKWSRLILLLLIIFVIWLVFGFVTALQPLGVKDTGPFGDTFGILNTLFSGAAFAALIYTVSLQRKELALQRQELMLTRGELQGQREQMVEQNRQMIQQRFEATFFRMIELHHEIVQAIHLTSTSSSAITLSGRDALRDFGEFLRSQCSQSDFGPNGPTRLKGVIDFYMANYKERQHVLAHYCRNLYRILKLVNEADLPDRRIYSGILRAQLSNAELVILFFNGLSPLGRDKFKPLAERYALFEHIPAEEPFLNRFRAEYDSAAFGSNAPNPAAPLPHPTFE